MVFVQSGGEGLLYALRIKSGRRICARRPSYAAVCGRLGREGFRSVFLLAPAALFFGRRRLLRLLPHGVLRTAGHCISAKCSIVLVKLSIVLPGLPWVMLYRGRWRMCSSGATFPSLREVVFAAWIFAGRSRVHVLGRYPINGSQRFRHAMRKFWAFMIASSPCLCSVLWK